METLTKSEFIQQIKKMETNFTREDFLRQKKKIELNFSEDFEKRFYSIRNGILK